MQDSVAIAPGIEGELLIQRRRLPFWAEFLRRLAREKPLGLAGGILVLILTIFAIGAPVLASSSPTRLSGRERLESPSAQHIFGTDNLGRDVYSRVVYGARISMRVGLLAIIIATSIALTIGIVSGFFGGWVDMLFQRLVDAWISFPGLVLILVVVAVLGNGINELTFTIGVLLGVGNSRVIRSATLAVKGMPYVEAARCLGAANGRIIMRHVLPNVVAPAITLATLGLGTAILLEASLSFLGLGVPPDRPTWGGMLSREGRPFMVQAPWLAIFPGVAISIAVFGFNMLGDAMRDLFDPRLRKA
jgi:peptide/nickel transport system permease protein